MTTPTTGTALLARFLDRGEFKTKIHTNIEAICAFTGLPITEGCLKRDVILSNFTDYQAVKYESSTNYVSVDVALCLASVIMGNTRLNSLRNYSYYADENGLILLSREQILPYLIAPPSTPFVLAISENQKKHTAYNCELNSDNRLFSVASDTLGKVEIDLDIVDKFLPIIQKWYTTIPEKKESSTPSTYFTKAEIITGKVDNTDKIAHYGEVNFTRENEFLAQFRGFPVFHLIVHCLNKL